MMTVRLAAKGRVRHEYGAQAFFRLTKNALPCVKALSRHKTRGPHRTYCTPGLLVISNLIILYKKKKKKRKKKRKMEVLGTVSAILGLVALSPAAIKLGKKCYRFAKDARIIEEQLRGYWKELRLAGNIIEITLTSFDEEGKCTRSSLTLDYMGKERIGMRLKAAGSDLLEKLRRLQHDMRGIVSRSSLVTVYRWTTRYERSFMALVRDLKFIHTMLNIIVCTMCLDRLRQLLTEATDQVAQQEINRNM
jgi:hypothetical protein